MPFIVQLLTELLALGPELFADVDNVFNSIAHGEGGAQKVAKATAALTTLTQHASEVYNSTAGS